MNQAFMYDAGVCTLFSKFGSGLAAVRPEGVTVRETFSCTLEELQELVPDW